MVTKSATDLLFSLESAQLWLSCNISKLTTIVRNLPKSTFFRLSALLWHISWGGLTNISNLCGGWVALSFNALQGFSSQSHYMYISCAVSNFYGTEFVIWAGFGLVGSTENRPTYQLLSTLEDSFLGFFFKYCSVHTKKWIKVRSGN